MTETDTQDVPSLVERLRAEVPGCDDPKDYPQFDRDILAACDALEAMQSGAGVRVRKLEWSEIEEDRGDGTSEPNGNWEAECSLGIYNIEMYFGTDSYGWAVALNEDFVIDTDTPEAAKSAAQADFEQRILASLESTPQPGVTLLACGECGKPIRPEDETIIGDVPFHRACGDAWADRNAHAIAGTPQPGVSDATLRQVQELVQHHVTDDDDRTTLSLALEAALALALTPDATNGGGARGVCETCQGSGEITTDPGDGSDETAEECPACKGTDGHTPSAQPDAGDGPERLWLSAPDEDHEHAVWFEPDEGGTEYVRADLYTAVCRERDSYRNMADGYGKLDADFALATRHTETAEQKIKRLREALEPSDQTRFAYLGQFSMGVTLMLRGQEEYRRVQIPWDSIKEIMAAIRARALNPSEDG